MNPPPRSSATGWSPNRRLWDELQNLGEGLSWRKVAFELSREHLLPGDHGVYLICAAPPTKTIDIVKAYTILYAGRVTGSRRGLRDRFIDHIKNPSAKLKIFLDCYYPTVHFWFAAIKDLSRIDDLEILLIETFRPPCNSIRAPGTKALLARLGTGRTIGISSRRQST